MSNNTLARNPSVSTRMHSFSGGNAKKYEKDILEAKSKETLNGKKNVAILLCTYNGQRYLPAQIESIGKQDFRNWSVCASDDGSIDETSNVLMQYKKKWGSDRLSIYSGPKQGFTANFLSLVCNNAISADYYAYADQDDVWENDKLERAIGWLNTIPEDMPALYCSRTRLIDQDDRDLGYSPLFNRMPSFANALVQNIGGGNTMIFNDAARRLLCIGGPDVKVPAHDWWTYMVVAGCGGKIFYDTYPATRYRQHGQNLYGSNIHLAARIRRAKLLFEGHFREWNEQNVAALQKIRTYLTPANRKILDEFSAARELGLLGRVISLRKSRVYRQTLVGNLGLAAAAVFKKI